MGLGEFLPPLTPYKYVTWDRITMIFKPNYNNIFHPTDKNIGKREVILSQGRCEGKIYYPFSVNYSYKTIDLPDMSRNIIMDNMFQWVRQDLSNLRGVKMSLVASQDGYIFSQPAESNIEKYAKASATMLRTADVAISKSGQNCSRVIIDYPNERLIATRAGPKALVAVLIEPDTKLDPIIPELDKVARKVQEIL